jgi:hypothetical protein
MRRDIKDRAVSPENAPRTHQSQRFIANAVGVSKGSVYNILKEDFKSVRKVKVHRISQTNLVRRVDRSNLLLQRFPTDDSLENLIFTDEKRFELEHCVNSQNERINIPILFRKSDVPPEK